MARDTCSGFLFEDLPQPSARSVRDRPTILPSIPHTGWTAPREFPRLDSVKLIGLDTETKDLELTTKGPGVRRGAHIIGLSIATDDRAWYFPIRHEVCPEQNMDPDVVLNWAKDVLTRPGVAKCGANIIYDADFLMEVGVDIGKDLHDIQVAEALIDENRDSFSLDTLAHHYLGVGKEKTVLEDWAQAAYGTRGDFRANLWRCPPSLVGPYAEADASLPLRILKLQQMKHAQDGTAYLYEVERGILPLLLAMRRRGVRVDIAKTNGIKEKLLEHIVREETSLNKLAGFDVNVSAGASLARLFDDLHLEYPKTAKGAPSFTKDFLEHHGDQVPRTISQIRRWKKFLSTFIQGFLLDMNVNGRIHCQFNSTKGDEFGARSGRLSSSSPNIQQIPARDPKWGPLIRGCFIPDDDSRWVRFDWSQIEFRLLVHYAIGKGSEEARTAYKTDPDTDFHTMISKMAALNRGDSKTLNFALVYGQGEGATADILGRPLDEAQALFLTYHQAFPFIKRTYNHYMDMASREGYIQTILGRRRHFDLWQPYSNNGEAQAVALPFSEAKDAWPGRRLKRAYTHKALNAELQGSAADMMKFAMYKLDRSHALDVLGPPMLTVHDELDFSAPPTREADEALQEVKHIMENCVPLSVPVLVAMDIADDWGKAKS